MVRRTLTETTFTYDGNGNLLTLTDGRGKTTTWTYDNMDRVGTRTDPLTRQESFGYDLNGNLTTWTDRKAQVTQYTYDALDRQTFVGFGMTGTPPTSASNITMSHDAGNRVTAIIDSGAGTISRSYDLLDRLTQEVSPEGTISYTYDTVNRRTSMTVAGQTAVSYTYDNADRLMTLIRGTSTVSFSYDNDDRRTSLTLPNGIVTEYGYDDDSELTNLTYKLGSMTIGTLTYTYDPNGLRRSVGGTFARTGMPTAVNSATYDDANQIATWAGIAFTYDANGNLTSDGARSYTWNQRDQLASVTGQSSATFSYDGLGRRRARAFGSMTTDFLYDGPNLALELSGGTVAANMLTGSDFDEYLSRTDASTTLSYVTDVLGSSVALTNNAGTILKEYTYEPFGGTSTTGQATGNIFAFTGREADATGLYYHRARYYDPQLQRFLSEDPFAYDPLTLLPLSQLYSYASNSPTTYTDPTGESALSSTMTQVGVRIAAGAAGVSTGSAIAAGAIFAGAVCAVTPVCRREARCFWEWVKDFASCKTMKCDNPADEFDCRDRAAQNYRKCRQGWGTRPYPDVTRPYPRPRSAPRPN